MSVCQPDFSGKFGRGENLLKDFRQRARIIFEAEPLLGWFDFVIHNLDFFLLCEERTDSNTSG